MLDSTFQCAIFCLNSTIEINVNSIFRYIIDVLEIAKSGSPASKEMVSKVIANTGSNLVSNLFYGLIYKFPKDRQIYADVGEIITLLKESVGPEMSFGFVKHKIDSIPEHEMPVELKNNFLTKLQSLSND